MSTLKGITAVLFCFYAMLSYGQSSIIWNGGITEDERMAAPQEGTKLVFFVSGGNYLANITVTITNDRDQAIIDTRAEGPWLIVRLPAGSYQLVAERENGDRQSLRIELDENDNSEIGIMFPGD